jgi:SAM-dependent methyltransferase
MKHSLNVIQRIYNWWGRHPLVFQVAAWAAFMGRQSFLRRRAVERVRLQRGDTVLDLACGNGANLRLLRERIGPQGRLLAFDYNRHMLAGARQRARARGWQNVQFIRGDAARLSLGQDALDGALCSLALSVIPDHRAAMEAVERALKPGRHFVVLDAHLFEGVWEPLNSILVPIGEQFTGWDASKDLIGDLDRVFGHVSVEKHNGGSIFLAQAAKR